MPDVEVGSLTDNAGAGLRPGDVQLNPGDVGVHGSAQFEAVLDRIDTGKPVSAPVPREQWTRLFVIKPHE